MFFRYFLKRKKLVFIACWLSLFALPFLLAKAAMAESNNLSLESENESPKATLKVKPRRCVALHQGQTCYQKLKFSWHSKSKGHYCLYTDTSETPIRCWQQVDNGRYSVEFQSPENLTFVLREHGASQDSAQDIASLSVEVAWVYKSRRQSKMNWRLF